MKTVQKNFWDNFKFEFALYINERNVRDNGSRPIICQRMFDVKRFNKDSLKSLELKELIDNLTGIHTDNMGIIPNFLKGLSKKASWRTYNPYRVVDTEESITNIFDNEDTFTFEIKYNKEIIAKSEFSGNYFQTDVRYAVNIKEIVPQIIDEINEYLSRTEYTTSFAGYDLKSPLAPQYFGV